MEFSEEISPIMDSKMRVPLELACPALKASVDSVFDSIFTFIERKKIASFSQWKLVTLGHSRIEEKQIKNSMFLVRSRLAFVNKTFENIVSRTVHSTFFEILTRKDLIVVEESLEKKTFTELETLKLDESQAKKKLVEIKNAFYLLQKSEKKNLTGAELKKNDSSLKLAQEDKEILQKIKEIIDENSRLQDNLVNYELSFNSYIQETERIFKKSQSGKLITPIKARLY